MPVARIDTLLRPAARCAAIELVAWVLQRSPRRFSLRYKNRQQLRHRSRLQEGLARNMCGLLMSASAEDFDDFADRFREFALDEFKAAVTLLPKAYQPHYNLAMLNEAAGKAATDSGERYKFFAAATDEYDAAMVVSERLPDPGKTDVQRKINVGRLHAELISDIPKLVDNALGKLAGAEGEPDFAANWPARRPERRRRRNEAEHDAVKSTLDDATAECLYNSACVYALAADGATGRDFGTTRDGWDRHARRLLGAALVRDGSHGYLWSRAGTDRDLRRLTYRLDDFMAQLRERLVDGHIDPHDPTQIMKTVDQAAVAAGWVAHAPASRWLSKARWPASKRTARADRPVRPSHTR